ncbi:glutaminase A [Legionella worsleiensis]|uniref:Glutaminase n=1 Tax=Legionella worsleiensis TaxID=45076 RepID=A0A0W1AL17_9GAMM|nr:glutaminase A [Legionella worsleiensis]KTD81936.1 glutaminase [Legionella worsleiensis]STY31286.1 glutaminase [Legionella worsleiensis]
MTQNALTINLLKELVESAELNKAGNTASYIPELANVNQELTALAVQQIGEQPLLWSNAELSPVTLQSTSKLIPLIGLLEEVGAEQLFEWVKVEPSGDDFASITRLEQFGPKPSNPMLNAGAITLCSHIPGTGEHQFGWMEHWVKKLFNEKLSINPLVYASEKRTGDRNRSLAYILKSRNNLGSDVNETLDLYFALCSYEATLEQMLYLPLLLANGGVDPQTGEQIISAQTCKITLAIMATCGLYDETGTHMVKTGIPAKSGVSGYIIGTVPGKAGIVALSPRVNAKGNSIRGELMLEGLSEAMKWHFALP